MIIVNLKGGLGNQMFQYALGRHLAIKNDTELKLDVGGLAHANAVGDIYRPFALDQFNTTATVATPKEAHTLKYPYGLISKAAKLFTSKILRQTNTVFRPSVLGWQGDRYLDGYWQSPRYFDAIREVLLREFTLKGPSEAFLKRRRAMDEVEAVSVHIRRGDYVSDPRVLREFGICTPAYYASAIEYMNKHISNPTYYVFSDNISWVEQNLLLPDTSVFMNDPDLSDAEELMLMSSSKHNIIANSSFSWWGAWLNQNLDKIVVAPTPWFESAPYDLHLIPKTWITLPKA